MKDMLVTIAEESVLRWPDMRDDEFFDFCQENSEYRIERDARGRVMIMPGTGGRTGDRSSEINFQMRAYARQLGTGRVFDSSTMFLMPNSAMRSPDAAWVSLDRLRAIPDAQRDRFLPLAPDFVIELRSPSDRLGDAREKMREWIANGTQLGWLLDPVARTVDIFQPGQPETRLENPSRLCAEGVLDGFVLDLQPVWEPGW